jgi:hypothetical protein
MLVLAAAMALAACVSWQRALDATPWTYRVDIAGLPLRVPVAGTLRFATSSMGGPLLHGWRVRRGDGVVGFQWRRERQQLEIVCEPCRIEIAALSEAPIAIPRLRVAVRRNGNLLAGEFSAGEVRGEWLGTLERRGLKLAGRLPQTPLAAVYALFRKDLPEAATARIDGSLSLRATLDLPEGTLQVEPRLLVAAVDGLGTDVLRGLVPRPHCGLAQGATPGARARRGRILLRSAVIAAEDQRFYEHAGFDPAAIADWVSLNARRRSIVGGASTLTQQLAKLLFVGGQRTHLRKLRELLYAVEMEHRLGKAQILDLYLALAPWGPGICGADAAARHYFGKAVEALAVSEAAWMAGVLRNASSVAMDAKAQAARAARVVGAMSGISRTQRRAALRALAQTAARR